MSAELALAFLAGLGGMCGWGVADFFAKKTIDQVGDVTTLFWAQLIGVAPLGALFLLNPAAPRLDAAGWCFAVVLGVWSGLSYIPTYVAFGKGQVSVLSPIFASYAVVVAILSALLLHEHIPAGRAAAFVVVFAGVLLINGDPRELLRLGTRDGRRLFGVPGLKEILLAVGLYSLWLIGLDRFLEGRNWVPLLLAIRICSAISVFGYARARSLSLRVPTRSVWPYLVLIGVFDVAAFASVSFGFARTPYTSVVAMLSGAFSLPTIVLAHVFLKERMTRLQVIGSLVSIGGIMLVYAI